MSFNDWGLKFPITGQNRRSTIQFSTHLMRHLLSDPNRFIKSEKKFRFNYPIFFKEIVKQSLESKKSAIKIAKNGLNFLHSNISFVRKNGVCVSFAREMDENTNCPFLTKEITPKSAQKDSSSNFSVSFKGKNLQKEELCLLLDKWAHKGVLERDAEQSLARLAMDNCLEGKRKLLADHCFVLIGANSAMGPFESLVELGATIVAINRPGETAWGRLIGKVKNAKNAGAKLIYPYTKTERNGEEVEMPGCDMLTQPAEILNWLKALPQLIGKTVTLGNYTYLDGANHVLLSLAADAIREGLSSVRETNFATLGSPADVSVIPKEAFYASRERWRSLHPGMITEKIINLFSLNTQLVRNDIEHVHGEYIYNGLTVKQGPNYALAKTIQTWSSIVHHSDPTKGRVSLNIAPATSTVSLLSDRTIKMALKGISYFKPIQIFDQDTSRTLMAGLLLHDVLSTEKKDTDINPVLIKSQNSVHGGTWRCAYSQNSIGLASLMVYILGEKSFEFIGVAILIVPIVVVILAMFVLN